MQAYRKAEAARQRLAERNSELERELSRALYRISELENGDVAKLQAALDSARKVLHNLLSGIARPLRDIDDEEVLQHDRDLAGLLASVRATRETVLTGTPEAVAAVAERVRPMDQ